MSNKIPTPIVDVNGVQTTRHKNAPKASTDRIRTLKPKKPAKANATAFFEKLENEAMRRYVIYVDDFSFSSEQYSDGIEITQQRLLLDNKVIGIMVVEGQPIYYKLNRKGEEVSLEQDSPDYAKLSDAFEKTAKKKGDVVGATPPEAVVLSPEKIAKRTFKLVRNSYHYDEDVTLKVIDDNAATLRIGRVFSDRLYNITVPKDIEESDIAITQVKKNGEVETGYFNQDAERIRAAYRQAQYVPRRSRPEYVEG